MNSYLTTKTISHKTINEDFIETFSNLNLKCKGFIVGDGIGSNYLPDEGSKFCVTKLKELLENCKSIKDFDFDLLYTSVYTGLKENFETEEVDAKVEDKKQAFGTTLICVIEFEDKFIMAYLGNGSIWHLRGNFTNFSEQRYLPWNAINILNPHTIEVGGKEVLYKFFALECTELQIKPSVIEIKKDNDIYGDLIIASTDGLYSTDHIPIAKDREGNIWISGEKKMEMLFSSLTNFTQIENFQFVDLEKNINTFLEEINSNKLIDDDTTFGLIISNQALKYQRLINENNSDTKQ